ncbi:histidine kinase CKI1-like [Bidens hawaiensis]|uniref:histidine kinase CKI1-like n=1 Tax=Bidens hawaiensis TaxID=980011 RepID=UPI00404B22FE
MNKTHQEIGSIIQQATTSLLLMNSSATSLAKIVFRPLGETDVKFSHIKAKVAPILFEALLTIPRVTQILYIRKDGLFFALYSQADQQIFAVYSNTSSAKHPSARFSYPWYTQRADHNTGNLYGQAVLFPTMVNETWLQQALNSTNGFAMIGNSWTDDKNPIVLNMARVDHIGVVSLGFELKSLLNVFSGIKPFGGGLYLATKDGKVVSDGIPNTCIVVEENATNYFQILETSGDQVTLRLNYETPKAINVEKIKYVVYLSSLDIIGMQTVYVLALPYDEVQSKMHWHLVMASVLSTLMVVIVVIFIAINEMCLRAALIKQKEATRQLGLVNSILNTSKIEAGKMELEEKPFDLVKALENVVDLFYPVGLKKEVDLILDMHDDLLTKYSQVKGDELRLIQILSNLLSNAIKFTSEGHVSVHVRARARLNSQSSITGSDHDRFKRWRSSLCFGNDDECGGDIEMGNGVSCDHDCMDFVFEVADTGKGITKEQRVSIFEKLKELNMNLKALD